MTDDKLKKIWAVYTGCWQFFKRFSNPDGTDEFWAELVKAEEFEYRPKYDCELYRCIIRATVDEITRIEKETLGGTDRQTKNPGRE